ncbi:MAG: hypothetical protein GY943_11970, partial [Chloroflexi bacterium]|nr:hypothetical protein [Chloroflexota bacterium]
MFDWQTDEDESVWKEDAAPPKETAVSPKRHWWGYLLAAGLLLLGSTFVYRQLKQQAETAVVAVEEDILSTHNLLISATKAGDADLVRVLLSGRDLSWVDAHEQLAAQSLTYNRTPLAMAWEPENQTIVETDINPALDTAELIFDQEYVTALPDGETETITLRQTAVYRLGRTRWLLSPPDDEFWGAWETIENDQLILIYPNRDQEIATRLFPDLLTILEISCRTLADIECDTDQQISVRLDKKLQSMADMGDPAALFSQGLRLELPTPSLVGMPVDDASYEALLRGYATALVTAVIADATEWDCCEHAAIFQALTDFQLDQVGLRAWPVTLDDHIDLWNGEELTTLEGLFLFWNQEGFVDLDAED